MDRRQFAGFAMLTLVAASRTAHGQRQVPKVRVIGELGLGMGSDSLAELRAALERLGWVDGRNLRIERRHAPTAEQLRPLAQELVMLEVDAILTDGTAATLVAKGATATIPIVFSAGDPVAANIVTNLARPDGNVTGFSLAFTQVDIKRVEVLAELLPSARRIGVIESSNTYSPANRDGLTQGSKSRGIELGFVEVAAAGELNGAVDALVRAGGQALIVRSSAMTHEHRGEILRAALRHSLPLMASGLWVHEAGALLSYDASRPEALERIASYVDRILRGANPGSLPVEQPTRFDLKLNLKTAQLLGITVPRPLLLRATEVIR